MRKPMTNDMNRPQNSLHNQKKEYQSPKLVVYGNIREITKNVGKTGRTDNGKGNTTKSQL